MQESVEKLEDELDDLTPLALNQKDTVHTQKKWRNYVPTTESPQEKQRMAFLRRIGFKGLLLPRKWRHTGKRNIPNHH